MLLNFRKHHVKQMTISVGTEYTILRVVLLICKEKDGEMNTNLFDPQLSRLNNASQIHRD